MLCLWDNEQDLFKYVFITLTTIQLIKSTIINGSTRVRRPAMPPVVFEPITPVYILAIDHSRQQAP